MNDLVLKQLQQIHTLPQQTPRSWSRLFQCAFLSGSEKDGVAAVSLGTPGDGDACCACECHLSRVDMEKKSCAAPVGTSSTFSSLK